jgi:hypothetical protein
MEMKCQRCGYEWNYEGRNYYYATCPKCFTKVSYRLNKERNEKKDLPPKKP